jgi:hypothetical protein
MEMMKSNVAMMNKAQGYDITIVCTCNTEQENFWQVSTIHA